MLETLSRIILLQLAEIFSARQRASLRKEVLGFMSTQLGLSPKHTRTHHLSSHALLTASPPCIFTPGKRPVCQWIHLPNSFIHQISSSSKWTRFPRERLRTTQTGRCRGSIVLPGTSDGRRAVWREVWGALCWGVGAQGRRRSASCDHITLDDGRVLQRNSSMQFVGSHNWSSSAKAGCWAASGTCHSAGNVNQRRWTPRTTVTFIDGCKSSDPRVYFHSMISFQNKVGLLAQTIKCNLKIRFWTDVLNAVIDLLGEKKKKKKGGWETAEEKLLDRVKLEKQNLFLVLFCDTF